MLKQTLEVATDEGEIITIEAWGNHHVGTRFYGEYQTGKVVKVVKGLILSKTNQKEQSSCPMNKPW